MATTYMQLVNSVLGRVNETRLTTTNFASATRGVHGHAKEAVNTAIRETCAEELKWPFLWAEGTVNTVAGTQKYTFDNTVKIVDWDSFRIESGGTIGPRNLPLIDYKDWMDNHREEDIKAIADATYVAPEYVFKTPDYNFGISPVPDAVYGIKFDYWQTPTELANFDDTLIIPDAYRQVVEDGAMAHMYNFRDNEGAAQQSLNKWKMGVQRMRIALINNESYVRSTMIERSNKSI